MLIETGEQALRIGVSVETLRDYVRKGIIPVVKINSKTWRFDPEEVEAALKEHAKQNMERDK